MPSKSPSALALPVKLHATTSADKNVRLVISILRPELAARDSPPQLYSPHPKLKVSRGFIAPSLRCARRCCQTVWANQTMDDQEKELERKLERALAAFVWGRQQPDFSSDDRAKLLSNVTDARIELWEYRRSQKATAT